jgi:hypothetical protein
MILDTFTGTKFIVLLKKFFVEHIKKLTAETLGWMSAITLHLSTVPSMVALMTGLSDKTPGLDIVAFIYVSLILMFAKAIIMKDQLNIITIGVGFICQAAAMAFILFK